MPSTATATHATRSATLRAAALVLTGSLGVQVSAVLALTLFERLGVIGASGLRMAIAAVLLVVIFRPRLGGHNRDEWLGIVLYGVAMAAMNVFLFLAIDRIPLGIATTIDFLGPCLVALAASRGLREGALALLAFGGVALIAGLGGPLDPLGLVFAACAGACFGMYTLLAPRIGKSAGGMQSMSLSVVVAALLTTPWSIPALSRVELGDWWVLGLSAAVGMALAFVVDTAAGRLTSARVIGVFFAFDPVVGTIVGALWLGQGLTLPSLIGIALVVTAGAGIVWLAGRRAAEREAVHLVARHEAPVESFEVERKYAVEDPAALPAAASFAELGMTLDAQVVHELRASYFDTPDGALAAQRFAVRMRVGGKDAGWHLKEKGEDGARELLWPPADEMPAGMLDELVARLDEATVQQIGPIASLHTIRTVVRVRDRAGTEVIEIADDRVDAVNELTGKRQQWREWEAELAPGADASLLDLVEPLLIAAGATRVRGTSKIQRTMS